jgi:hypothetical protein
MFGKFAGNSYAQVSGKQSIIVIDSDNRNL